MTFLEAPEAILQAAKRPLTVSEITEAALRKGLIHPQGRTPEATMSAALYGAPADGRIQREFTRGKQRAVRGSVRWKYVGPGRSARYYGVAPNVSWTSAKSPGWSLFHSSWGTLTCRHGTPVRRVAFSHQMRAARSLCATSMSSRPLVSMRW